MVVRIYMARGRLMVVVRPPLPAMLADRWQRQQLITGRASCVCRIIKLKESVSSARKLQRDLAWCSSG